MELAPLRVLIVDDEPLARARARRMLGEAGGVEIVGEAGSAAEARPLVESTRPDVMLLDIQMPGGDGFELLRSLGVRPAVVFVTAFDHYAVRAFEENAVDYLLKPFRAERLAEALRRARADLGRPAELERRLTALLEGLRRPAADTCLERFTVRVATRQVILAAAAIRWFGAEDKLVFAATECGRHYVNFTLDQLERRLDPKRFTRVHRGAIVNLDHVAALRPGFAGTWRIELKGGGDEVPVSRQRAKALRERLGA
ncbi:MAG: response regulator transcription factor [Candidatus Eisenbacteria bacterium]|nr:response regulator transcription factor [Candidatus Eisenbacteria bacterium]